MSLLINEFDTNLDIVYENKSLILEYFILLIKQQKEKQIEIGIYGAGSMISLVRDSFTEEYEISII